MKKILLTITAVFISGQICAHPAEHHGELKQLTLKEINQKSITALTALRNRDYRNADSELIKIISGTRAQQPIIQPETEQEAKESYVRQFQLGKKLFPKGQRAYLEYSSWAEASSCKVPADMLSKTNELGQFSEVEVTDPRVLKTASGSLFIKVKIIKNTAESIGASTYNTAGPSCEVTTPLIYLRPEGY